MKGCMHETERQQQRNRLKGYWKSQGMKHWGHELSQAVSPGKERCGQTGKMLTVNSTDWWLLASRFGTQAETQVWSEAKGFCWGGGHADLKVTIRLQCQDLQQTVSYRELGLTWEVRDTGVTRVVKEGTSGWVILHWKCLCHEKSREQWRGLQRIPS